MGTLPTGSTAALFPAELAPNQLTAPLADVLARAPADWAPLVQAWQAFSTQVGNPAAPWLTVQHHGGPQAVQAAYAQVLAGRGDPRTGHMLSMG